MEGWFVAVRDTAAGLVRPLIRLALACGVGLTATSTDVTVAVAAPGDTSTSRVVLALPAPTGEYPVGVTDLDLVDPGRADPWRPDQRRELMVHLWYPASDGGGPVTGWMPPGADQEETDYLTSLGVAPNSWTLGAGHSHQNAPASTEGPFPVLLYSPGMDDAAGWNVAQAEDLASHGYAVAEINHTHEAFEVAFPDGRTEHTMVPLTTPLQVMNDALLPVRVSDIRFVLDQLNAMTADPSPSEEPVGLAASLDSSRIGMFGHSLGGSTTVEAMHEDSRIRAGVNFDGPILGSVSQGGLAQPLLMLASEVQPIDTRPGWEPTWLNNSGFKLPLLVSGSEHMSFDDQQVILPQLVDAHLLPAARAKSAIGWIAPTRSLDLQRTYLRTYFQAAFNNTDIPDALTHLDYPEVVANP